MQLSKNRLKKSIESILLNDSYSKAKGFHLFSLKKLKQKDSILLRKLLIEENFNSILIRNKSILNFFFTKDQNIDFSGSLLLIYSSKKEEDFMKLKNIFKKIKSIKNLSFLGSLYKGNLKNNLYKDYIDKLEDRATINFKLSSLLTQPIFDVKLTITYNSSLLSTNINYKNIK